MSLLKTSVPCGKKEFQNQTVAVSISESEFSEFSKPFHYSLCAVIHQIICFILFLGPIRILLCAFLLAFSYILLVFMHALFRMLQLPQRVGRSILFSIARFGVRSSLFCLGIVYIGTNQYFDEASRFAISNHVCLLDLLVLSLFHDYTYVADSKLKKIKLLKILLDILDPVYLNGKNRQNRIKIVCDAADDSNRPTILIFPEGFKSNACSDVLVKFDKTAFVTPYKIQPITISYTMFGVMNNQINTYAYRFSEHYLSYLWRLFAMPPSVVHLRYLSSISMDRDGKSDIKTFVNNSQLLLGNQMGIRCVNWNEGKKYHK